MVVLNHLLIISSLRYTREFWTVAVYFVTHHDGIEFTNIAQHFSFYQVVFFGIDNIHAMRESLSRLREYLDTHGTTSSDGMSSFLVSLQ